MKTNLKKPVMLALGAAIAGSMAMATVASAAAFNASDLGQGYAQAGASTFADGDKGQEGKCGEGKCGADKKEAGKGAEGKCGEGKCGADNKGAGDKGKEGKCGEGKCGGDKKSS